ASSSTTPAPTASTPRRPGPSSTHPRAWTSTWR
ncbi:MAG: hypothetical protein AVDCRST_MAG60-617, partial [uncultured Nocardioides sp.]